MVQEEKPNPNGPNRYTLVTLCNYNPILPLSSDCYNFAVQWYPDLTHTSTHRPLEQRKQGNLERMEKLVVTLSIKNREGPLERI